MTRHTTRTTTTRRTKVRRRRSSFKRHNAFIRFLVRLPHWLMWCVGTGIVLFFILAVLPVVLHFSLPWKALFGEVPEPSGYEVRGIDISHYQRTINWRELGDATLSGHSVNFVIMKATEGTSILDNTFAENFKKAKKNDFVRGAYHYFIPSTSADKQAAYYLSNVKLQPGDLPPILDVEVDGGLSVRELQSVVRKWLKTVGHHFGTKPIIYTNYAFKKKYLDTKEFNDYPFWIAHYYKDKLEYKGKWTLWQYTDCGRVKGVSDRVDCNVFNGSIDDLKELCITEDQFPINIAK